MKDVTTECQYIGPEQKNYPFVMCGCKTFPGKKYCQDHLWLVYKKGTSSGNKRKIAAIEKELKEMKQIEEIAEVNGVFEA